MTDLSIFENYLAYFESLATNHATLSHNNDNPTFGVIDMVSNQISAKLKKWVMLLEYPESSIQDPNDSYTEIFNGAFWIIKKPTSQKYEDVYTAISEAKQVAKEIIARMIRDEKNNVLAQFDAGNVQFNKVGPFESEFYGWRVEFAIISPTQLPIDLNKWNDL